MAKQTITQKEPVKLREKKLSNGNISLFLDIYRNGKRHKEYLKLYLIDAKTPIEKEQNRQTLATAQAIKSKRLIEIQNGEYSFTHQFKENTPFLEYYRNMVEERRKNPESKGNWGNWRSCLRYLEIYCDDKTTFMTLRRSLSWDSRSSWRMWKRIRTNVSDHAGRGTRFRDCRKTPKCPTSINCGPVSIRLSMNGSFLSIRSVA